MANVFHGLCAAISRQDHTGAPAGSWLPEEKLTREQALRAFTLDAAYAAHQKFKIGSLEKENGLILLLLIQTILRLHS